MTRTLGDFLTESFHIEGMHRMVSKAEHKEAERFMALERIELQDMIDFVKVFQSNAKFRTEEGLNVHVGRHLPPPGGVAVGYALADLLHKANEENSNPHLIHLEYELLHPFTDCNGRSGRILWLWQSKRMIGKLPHLSFLHNFYYHALDNARE